jgi:hypothetical protein
MGLGVDPGPLTVWRQPGRLAWRARVRCVCEAGADGEAITMIRVAETEISADLHGDLQLLWTREWFEGQGLHRLSGTVRYPKAA